MRFQVAVVLAALVVPGTPAPASAAATGTLSAPNDVLYDDCHEVAYSYSLTLDPGDVAWNLDVEVLAPDGTNFSSDYVSGTAVTTRGSSSFQVCSYEDAGTYTLRATGEARDSGYEYRTFTLPDATMTIRKARTQTKLNTPDHDLNKGQKFTFTIRVRDERPVGYRGTSYAEVVLQVRRSSKWVNLPGFRGTTNQNGVEQIKARWASDGPVTVRARTLPEGNLESSYSGPITLR